MSAFASLKFYLRCLFCGYSTPPCVGIDIGAATVKMVELLPRSLIIRNYTIANLSFQPLQDGMINHIEQIADILHAQWQKLAPQYSYAALAVPYTSIILKELITPRLEKYELDQYIAKQIGDDLESIDIDFDYKITQWQPENYTITVVAAKKEKLEEYQALMELAGLKIAAIDIEPFAIQYLFEYLLKTQQLKQQLLILDIGACRVRAYFFQNYKQILFNELSFTSHSHSPNLANLNNEKLADDIIATISRLLQLIQSNLLISNQGALSPDSTIYLMGGNSLAAKLDSQLTALQEFNIAFVDELFNLINPKIPRQDLLRLIPALALASWGHFE